MRNLSTTFIKTSLPVLISLSAFFASSAAFSSTDLIECKREKEGSRQFCYIKPNSFKISRKISKDKIFNEKSFDIGSVIQNGSMSVETSDGSTKPLILSGLEPLVKFKADWSQNQDCLRNSLWTHNIFAVTKVAQTDLTLAKINIGLNEYTINLNNLSSNGLTPWMLSEVDSEVEISTNLSFVDSDFHESSPLPQEKMSTVCKLTVQDMQLSYDARSISKDLSTLKVMALDKVNLLAQSTVIHANFIDSKQGAKCSAYGLGTTLRDVEILGESEPWDKLSLSSQEAIKSALRKSQALGGLSFALQNDTAIWEHFTSEEVQNLLKESCSPEKLLDYKISSKPFVEGNEVRNQAGLQNVLSFEREVRNLNEIMNAAWALAEASRLELVKSESTDWLENAGIYLHFPKEKE